MATQIATTVQAKPFIKWAGGKTQLLSQIRDHYPIELQDGRFQKYAEPFLGGGAVFIDIAQSFDIQSAYLSDINPELVLVYRAVQQDPHDLIELLEQHSQTYYGMDDEQRKTYFYSTRDFYNEQRNFIDYAVYSHEWVVRAANMIFLNKTCYNGLFRVNLKGGFNVPFGRYRRPTICDADNIIRISHLLDRAIITLGSFTACETFVTPQTFVYFDPPYRPLSQTASFTSYSKEKFDDRDQYRLAEFFAHLHDQYGAKLMLSNSDPKNVDPNDDFFDDLYKRFTIRRVLANRMINSNGEKRGKITELLITNY